MTVGKRVGPGRLSAAVLGVALLSWAVIGIDTAAARGDCTFGLVCGWIYNHDDRHRLMVTNHWPAHEHRSTWRIVRPNSSGRDAGVRDVDGFWVGPGCKVKIAGIRWFGPGWHRIRDGQFVHVTDIRC